MIATRERLSISELLSLHPCSGTHLLDLFNGILPTQERHCVFLNQGKAAFEQIVLAAELQRSRIILPAFFPDDFVGVMRKYEMKPVFADVNPHTYHIDLDSLTARDLYGAKALILEHTFGLPAEARRARALCDQHGLVLIEDCARALGALHQGAPVGSFGSYALFSLPKCSPVRQGGIAVSEKPLQQPLREAKVGILGLLHALTLVRYPLLSFVEAPLYRLLADSPLYPLEVGNYDSLPPTEFDWLGRLVLASFMPHYREAMRLKRECALRIRAALEPLGFKFQADGGEHIYTALSVEPPQDCDPDLLHDYLLGRGVKTNRMWRDSLGISNLARSEWGADPKETPVALELSRRVLQLPVSRFQTPTESSLIVSLCERFISETSTHLPGPALAGTRF